jgi:glycosyltransferase involved in cell wall biosynthesis
MIDAKIRTPAITLGVGTFMTCVSIIIPCYNYGHTVERAIRSAVSQARQYIEIIVVNDGSTDDSLSVIQRCAREMPKLITIIDKPNGGVSSARNAGIAKAAGEYLLFLDADDELLPDAIESFVADIQTHGDVGILIGGKISEYPNGKRKICCAPRFSKLKEQAVFAYLFCKQCSMDNGCVLIHKSVFTELRYEEALRQAEDKVFFVRALARFSTRTLDKPIARIHKHPESLRHDVIIAANTTLRVVDYIFDNRYIPASLLHYRAKYQVLRYLSLFRSFYQAKDYQSAEKCFDDAWKASKWMAITGGYLLKYIRMRIRILLTDSR